MPIISIFCGIAVSMYFGDHPPPHIHIECQGYKALVRISDGSHGERDFSGLVQKDRPVLKLLRDPAYFIRIPGEGLGVDSCAVAKRVGWCAMSRGGRLWRGLLVI